VTVPMMAAALAFAACDTSEPGEPGPAEARVLVGTEWQWQEFQDSADGDEAHHIRVPDPGKYTLTLRSDGGVEIGADCNQLNWAYTLEGASLSFNTVGPTTLAHCGDQSLDQRYLERLGNTASFVLVDGTLYLNLRADGGNMVFAGAGSPD
jgi:heat shock protein HslJ